MSLSSMETAANVHYGKTVSANGLVAIKQEAQEHELYNPERMEHEFFTIYQFFERWYILTKNGEIDSFDADVLMHSYKDWYLSIFIEPLETKETDEYMLASLKGILEILRTK